MVRTKIARLWDNGDGLANVIWRVRHRPWLPYPLRSMRLSLEVRPFGFWLKPSWVHKRSLSEAARQDGKPIWWARWAWFQVSCGRWV